MMMNEFVLKMAIFQLELDCDEEKTYVMLTSNGCVYISNIFWSSLSPL